MLKNYITIAIRNFLKHKLYSAINVLGLALGMASCILMILFVRDEISYDKSFPNADNIYRIQMTFNRPNGTIIPFATSSVRLLKALEKEVPEIIRTQYFMMWKSRIVIGEKAFDENVNYVGPDFFSTFPLQFLAGDPNTALRRSNTAVISSELADSLFPGGQAIGRRLIVGEHPAVITGIIDSNHPNTHFRTEMFVSRQTIGDMKACGDLESWRPTCAFTYAELAPGGDPAKIDAALPKIIKEHAPSFVGLGNKWKGSEWYQLSSIPLTDIHLKSKRLNEMIPSGDISLVYVFSFLSVLILVIACINFTNLATARASDRSKEISIRKIVGAERRQIFAQVLGESILISTLALIIALTFTELALPYYNDVISKDLTLSYTADIGLMTALLLMSIGIGFIGGTYPAVFLSSFRPITLSKGVFAVVDRHLLLRSTLVVVQFAISIGLICATFVVYQQMSFARKQALQIESGSVLAIEVGKTKEAPNRMEPFKALLREIDGVELVGSSNYVPPSTKEVGFVRREDFRAGPNGFNEFKVLSTVSVDPEFLETYGIEVVVGRRFHHLPGLREKDLFHAPSKLHPETWANAILNEEAVRYLGYDDPEAALGKIVNYGQFVDYGQKNPDFVTHMRIIGVVPDSNFHNARQKIEPIIYYMAPMLNHALSLKLDTTTDKQRTLKWIKKSWKLFFPDEPIRMWFVDETYDELFAQELMRGQLFAGFSVLAMFIASLGLYGLASVSAERRTQEIGLRKVMGASVWDIVWLLVWQFSRPVLLANLIAWPIAFWAMRSWLDGFALHVDLTPTAFLGATAITVFVALATVTWHARKVAMAKPADTLRYE